MNDMSFLTTTLSTIVSGSTSRQLRLDRTGRNKCGPANISTGECFTERDTKAKAISMWLALAVDLLTDLLSKFFNSSSLSLLFLDRKLDVRSGLCYASTAS